MNTSGIINRVLTWFGLNKPSTPEIKPDPQATPHPEGFVPSGAGVYDKAPPPPPATPPPPNPLFDPRNLLLLVPYLGEHGFNTMKKILLDQAGASRLIDKDLVLSIFRGECPLVSLSPFAEGLLFTKALEDVSRIHSGLVLSSSPRPRTMAGGW